MRAVSIIRFTIPKITLVHAYIYRLNHYSLFPPLLQSLMIPAYDEQEGLQFRQIEELHPFDKSSKVKARFAGIVLKVSRDDKITSFVVSDGTATAEVTLIYRRLSPLLQLPAKGDSVQIVGTGYKKVLGGTKNPFSFLKIFASCIGRISPQEELQMCINAAMNRPNRMKESAKVETIEKLEPINQMRTFQSPHQKVELKTLVMTYCYYVFEHNTDINSYIFNAEMIRLSKCGTQFINDARVTKACLQAALKRTLGEMVTVGLISEKNMTSDGKNQTFFVMKRELLRGIERAFEEKIIEMQPKGGVGIELLTGHVNRHLSDFYQSNFTLFDWKFSQKVLLKLQSQNKIYKTSDKIIFPNIRF